MWRSITSVLSLLIVFAAYLWPHAVRYATQDQGAQALGAWKHRIDQIPGQVTHCVVVCELQVGLPAQSLLGVFMLRRAFGAQPGPGLSTV